MRDYEPKVKNFNDKLVERIREHLNQPINVSKWLNLYSFDVMGKLAFGKDYRMLETGERHWALDLLTEGMEVAPARLPVWFFRILLAIPFAAKGFFKFLKFCHDELEARVNTKVTEGDITGWLLKAYKDWEKPADDPMFQGDSRLIVRCNWMFSIVCRDVLLTMRLRSWPVAIPPLQPLRSCSMSLRRSQKRSRSCGRS